MATAQSVLTLAVCILMITELILAQEDFYDILGVSRDATERQIKKAFHTLAMKYHPDRNKSPDAESKFREIAEAYETLSDDKRRREYDQFGHAPSPGEAPGGGRGGQPFSFDDMFKDFDFFGGHHHGAQQDAHSHHHNSHHKRAFESHFQAHQEAHQQAQNMHKRHFQQDAFAGAGAGAGLFDNIFEDLENMFSFNRNTAGNDRRFQGSVKHHCRTVTQRRGNMVTTYTDCS